MRSINRKEITGRIANIRIAAKTGRMIGREEMIPGAETSPITNMDITTIASNRTEPRGKNQQ